MWSTLSSRSDSRSQSADSVYDTRHGHTQVTSEKHKNHFISFVNI